MLLPQDWLGIIYLKKLHILKKQKKVLFGFFSSLFIAFIVYVNSCLGAYRSKAGEVFETQHGVDATEATRLTGVEINQIMTSVIKTMERRCFHLCLLVSY